jgi:hypothetical protein
MVAHVFQWIAHNQVIWGVVCTVLAMIIGVVVAPAKMIKLGFTVSQWIRKLFGAKIEKEFEDAIDAFDQGLHSDNK